MSSEEASRVTKVLRLVERGLSVAANARRPTAHQRAVIVVREATEHIDPDHMAYLVRRGIVIWRLLPSRFTWEAIRWLAPDADLLNLTAAEHLAAAREARPDCQECLDTPEGEAWLRGLFSWPKV